MQHPAFATTRWELVPERQGLLPVAAARGGPIDIAWEVHGTGPRRLLLICGLGFLKGAFQRQTKHFGHDRGGEHSVLLVDNRGMGGSGRPWRRYSTSEMARDLVEVLDHVGWTAPRGVHVAGISMGGMIAQELACLVPERVASLALLCTAAAIENTTGFAENMAQRVAMLLPKSPDRGVAYAADRIFARAWLDAPDDAELPDEHTPRAVVPPGGYGRFATNYERFAAQEVAKQRDTANFTKAGFLLQLIAAGWHHKSPAQLAAMADAVGRDRILVLHGTADNMISPPHGRKLIDYLRPGAGLMVDGMGHAPVLERTAWLHALLDERMAIAEKLDQ